MVIDIYGANGNRYIDLSTLSPLLTYHTALWLQFPPPITETDLLCAVWLVGESLTYVWARRKNREELSLNSLKLILKTKAVHMSKTDKYSNAGRQLIDILSAA